MVRYAVQREDGQLFADANEGIMGINLVWQPATDDVLQVVLFKNKRTCQEFIDKQPLLGCKPVKFI
jgi:hypothetical protein